MFNLSTQDVVSSIEKSPLVVNEGIYYQYYENFFGKEILKDLNSLENLKFEKLENQFDFLRQRIDYSETLMKKLKIFFYVMKLPT